MRPTLLLTFLLLLAGMMPLAAQPDCKPVFDALDKVVKTPTHMYTTSNVDGRSQTTEAIYADDAIYTKATGDWTKSKNTSQQVARQQQEDRPKRKYACSYVKDEEVDSEPAAVYSVHWEGGGQKSDGQIWISKARGLPLRNEVDLDKGDKSHFSVRYEYKNVQAPN